MNEKRDRSAKEVAVGVVGLIVLGFVLIVALLFGSATILYLQQSAAQKKTPEDAVRTTDTAK